MYATTICIVNCHIFTKVPIVSSVVEKSCTVSRIEGAAKGLEIETKTGVVIFDSDWTAGVDYEEEYDTDEDISCKDVEYENDAEHKDGVECKNCAEYENKNKNKTKHNPETKLGVSKVHDILSRTGHMSSDTMNVPENEENEENR